jgi:hypothetical protein
MKDGLNKFGGFDNEFNNHLYRDSIMGLADPGQIEIDPNENKANIRRKSKLLINRLRFNSNKNNENNSREINPEEKNTLKTYGELFVNEELENNDEIIYPTSHEHSKEKLKILIFRL